MNRRNHYRILVSAAVGLVIYAVMVELVTGHGELAFVSAAIVALLANSLLAYFGGDWVTATEVVQE